LNLGITPLKEFDDLVLAVGSGGTACGLAIANKLAGSPVNIHAVSVSDHAECAAQVLADICKISCIRGVLLSFAPGGRVAADV
jgi:1-aminocyclopropane-1-carboxylate deaminase/D-cysteine desulfhydrase-like pyridoxal-dependent ACC family enzyme